QVHYDRKVKCEACHNSVAHGGIARRGETGEDDTNWNRERAVTAMVWENTATTMDDCMQCHFRRKASTDCKACHTGLNLPEYHQVAEFTFSHGTPAREKLEECNVCHGYAERKKMEVRSDHTVTNYSRENTFCRDCHSLRPERHTERWKFDHAARTKLNGKEGCLVCHDDRPKNTLELSITPTQCGTCHRGGTHRKNWRAAHPNFPIMITEQTRFSMDCMQCHTNKCLQCHVPD
ncbi:MAG: cytochrome c3 family protein, partial [Bacillota bacterium]|nr:cytochrome c3 family protein [Bacillota bacterium]